MKFTEEQYQRIVKDWNDEFTYRESTQAVVEIVNNISHGMLEEGLALALPLTREWAHDKFVEKEKKYVWHSNKCDTDGNVLRLYKELSGAIVSISTSKDVSIDEDERLTESEIKAWGYDPEMFDREEVQ